MLDTDFHQFIVLVIIPRYHPWFSLDFCDARRSSSSVALPPFDFASCIQFHWFHHSHCHSPDRTLCLLQIFMIQE